MDSHLTFGDSLKAYRTARNLTQDELAERVGYSSVSIRKLEANQQRPSKFLAESLAKELALAPDEVTTFVRLARGPVSEISSTPRRATIHSNLPERLPPLVGRADEVQAICSVLRKPDTALLTLTGFGGVGKTRLALQVASELQSDFASGVCFVPLAPIRDQALVIPTIMRALNLQVEGSQKPDVLLKDTLREQELLLVLDNLEQIQDAASPIGELISAAPRLKILATSRSALHLYREQEFQVSCLALPDASQFHTIETIAQSPAVALFVAKAQAKFAGFRLTPANAQAVAEICIQLDGLPLALELAAAWSKLLSPRELLQQLNRRLELLKSGPIDVPERHRALRSTIDWSYQLLNADEQALFARLGVFIGGCTLPAIEAICVDRARPQARPILDQLDALIDKSILQIVPNSDGTVHFLVLESLHEYAAEQLRSGADYDEIRHRHAEYYLQLAQKIVPKSWEYEADRWLSGLLAEYGNLQATLYWLIEQGDGEGAAQMFEALVHFWTMQRKQSEIRSQIEVILEMADQLPNSRRLSIFGLAGGVFRGMINDYQRALECHTEHLRLARLQNDMATAAIAQVDLGLTLLELGEYDQAREHLQESFAIQETLPGPTRLMCAALRHLGTLAMYVSELDEARNFLSESLRLCRELQEKLDYASTLNQLGRVEFYAGNYSLAQTHCEESLALFRTLGYRRAYAHVLCNLGPVYLYQGDAARARTVLQESLITWQDLEDYHGNIWNLERLAEIAAQFNQIEKAVRLWGAAAAFRDHLHVPMPPVERQRYESPFVAAREQLSEAEWLVLWKEGRGLSLEQALALTLTVD